MEEIRIGVAGLGGRGRWCGFWSARARRRFEDVRWDGSVLRFRVEGAVGPTDLRIQMPAAWGPTTLKEARVNGRPAPWEVATRYRESVALLPVGNGSSGQVEAIYG